MDLEGMKRRELQALCKRHGLPAGGSNADLVARLDAALSGAAGAEEEVARVPARKGCLKQIDGDAAETKKVTFAAEEGKTRRLRSRVIWSPIVGKTRGKSAQVGTDSAAAEDSISAEVVADVPVRWSMRNSVVVTDIPVRRSRRNSVCAAETEEAGEAVAVDRKRKRKDQENDEAVAIGAQVGVSSRVTRRSSLAGPAAVLPPVVEKKRGRGKAAGGGSKLAAEAQDSEPDVQNLAQVEVSARITRSRATAPVVMSPTVVVNKRRRKTGDARANLELPTVSDVPRNDAPVTRSLRSRVVQVNNSTVDETHTARQLENKTQPSRPPTRRHQQVSSSAEDENQEQTVAPNKAPLLRRPGRNHSEDAKKQLEVKEPIKRSTRKSVVLATLEKEENDLVEEKNPEAHGRRSMRKSVVPVKDINGIGEKIHNNNSEDAVKQPATKGPVRRSRRKSVVSELHEKEKGLITEKNMEAHEGRSMRKPVMPVKDIKAVGEATENAKGKGAEKQFVVKQPIRRSSRKSVLPDMLENNSGILAAQMNAEMNVRRSTRKSVLPNMLNEENQDHSKLARKESFQSVTCKDDERQQKVKEPIKRSKRSVAAVLLEEPSNGLHEEKMSKNPMRRSTRKSVALDGVEKASMDHTEIVARELERVGEEGLKLRKHRRSSLQISSSANDSWKIEDFDGQKFKKQQNTPIPNEKDNTGGTQQASISTTLKGRSSKRRRTTVSEEVRSVKEANDDIIIREATKDAHKATREYKESGSRVQELGQVNATREEHSSGPLLITVTLPEEVSTAQSVPVVIPGSESGDNANESSDKSKQEHSDIQAVDIHLSETSGELDQSSCIAGLVLHNFDVSEDKSLMSKDGLSIDLTVGDHEGQSPVSEEGRVGLEANASEPGKKNLANVMSIGLHAKSLQHDTDVIAEETDKAPEVLPMAFPIEEHGEKYAVSPVAVEKSVVSEASACESAGKPLTGIFSNDLYTKHLQHDCDVLTKETGEASGGAPPISESDTNTEIQCNAEESIRAADLGKCPSRVSKGNPYSTSLHSEGAAADCFLPVLNADKGCSSDGRPSSFGLELLFADACKESYSKNIENTVGDCEEQSPISREGRVGLEANVSESGEKNLADIMSTGLYAKSLQHDTDIIAEETGKVAEESIRPADLEECPSRCSIGNPLSTSLHLEGAADDTSLPVLNADKGCSSDGRPSSFDLELMFEGGKESYSRNAENTAVEMNGGNKPSTPVTPGFYVRSGCLEDEDVQPTECDADKKLDVDEGVAEEVFAQEKSNDQHVPAKTDLNMKLNDELAGPGTESGCSSTEKNGRLVADILNQQAIIQVQQGDWHEGDLEKPSLCSATPECKHECDLAEETVLPSRNTASLPSTEQSSFGLESLFSQESIDKSVGYGALASATAHTENEFDDSKGCHVKSALENTHVSEPFSHYDTEGGISKNDDRMHTSQKDHIMAGLRKANLDEERVLSVFSLDAKHIEVINPEEVACEGECDADKKLDVDDGVEEEDFAQEKSNDQHVLAKIDLNMKLNDELAGPGTESGCSITEKNARLVADNLEEQATILVQQGDVKEGDLKKPSPCSTTPECKHQCGLPEETSLLPKNTRSLSSEEKSPFVLESLFSQENIDESMGCATAHTKNGFDDSKDCHVKSALENTHVSEPYSHDDTEEGISKNDDCTQTSQQDNGMEGLPEANLDEEQVLSVFSLDAKHIKEVINFEEVASEGERSKKFVHSEDFKASSEKTNVNGPDGNAYGITDAVLSSALHSPANDNYEICLGYNTDVLHQGQNDQCSDDTEDIIEDASAKDIERGIVLLSGKERSDLRDGELNPKLEGAKVVESVLYFNKDISNIFDSGSVVGEITPSGSGVSKDSSKEHRQEVLDGFSMQTSLDGSSTCGEKIVCRVDAIENEGALSEEAARTMKNYAGTCSSNPRELIMDLQSLFLKGNTKESDPHDSLALPSAENLGDESINVEQWVKVHHSSDLSHLDEPIGCSNTEVLRQGHNHKDRSIEDRVEQVASEPCRNDIVEAAATAKCIESGLVLPRSEERSNLNDDQLNPKLERPNIIVSGLDCDKDVCITSDNGSIVVFVGERTPSGSALPEDYPKDHYPRQELLDGSSVESSLQGIIFEKTIVSGVAAIGNPSSSLATPDNKYEGAGTSSIDPRHLVLDLQSIFSEGSTEKYNLQDLSRHEEKESCVSVPMQVKENGGFLRSSHMKGSLTSVQIDLADDAHLNERDVVAAVEVFCEEKVERKSMPTSDSDILQEKSYSNGHGICHSRSQKHIIEANSRLFSCGTEVLHQDHKECNEPNEGKFGPKALVENKMTEDAPTEGIGSSLMVPLVAGMSEIPDEQLKTKMSDESEELSFSCDKVTIENFCTGPAKRDLYPLPKDFHIDFCQKQVVPEVLSSPKSPEESAKFQCASLSGSGPCQQHVNESTSMQVTCNIETLNQDHEEYNQNNEDQTNSGISSSNVPEAVEIEQSEMEIGLIPAAEATVLPVPDEQLNNKLEGNEDQITPGILASCVPEAVEIEQSEMEIGLIPATEASVLPVPDEQLNNKLEGNGDQITPGFLASCVPEAVEIEQSEMEIGLIPAAEASVLPVPDEQLNNKLEGNEDQATPGIPASCVSEAVEIEQSEMEIGLIPAAETSLLPVSDEQPNRKLEDNEVDEHSCSYDSESLKREASNLSKDDCMDLSSEDNHPNDLPAPKSPEQSAFCQNDNDSGSVGIGQSSRQRGIAEIRAKLQSFKVSSTVKGSYIAMSAPRPKPGDSMSQSAIALLRNIENTTAAKAGHPVKPNADGKDSSRRALQPISGRPREH